jgi:hypothetical protein
MLNMLITFLGISFWTMMAWENFKFGKLGIAFKSADERTYPRVGHCPMGQTKTDPAPGPADP